MTAADLYSHWKVVRSGLLKMLGEVSDEQLLFCPRQDLWSLGQVACHIAESEEGWFRFCITGELPEWPAYQAADYATVDSLVALLSEVHDRTNSYLASLDEAKLHREFRTPWGETLTSSDVIWHVLVHEIHHRGEISLMLGLLGLEAPDV